MDSEMPYLLIWSLRIKCLVYHAVYCMSLSCLLLILCNPYNNIIIPFLIYDHLYYYNYDLLELQLILIKSAVIMHIA